MPQETQEITGRMVEDVIPPMLRILRDCEVALGIPPEPQSADALGELRQQLWGLVKACEPIIQQIGDTVVYYRLYERLLMLQHELEMAQEKLSSTPSPTGEPLPGQGVPVVGTSKIVFPPRRYSYPVYPAHDPNAQQEISNSPATQTPGDTHAAQ